MKPTSKYWLPFIGMAILGVLLWWNDNRNTPDLGRNDSVERSDGDKDESEVVEAESAPTDSGDTKEALEAALAEEGMGNLKVYDLPSTDPEYYQEKLRDTDSIVPDPEYLKSSSRPNVFREFIHAYLREPVSSEDLRFLEKKLRESDDEDIRIQCGALLYRYGVPAGERYLASRLEKRTEQITAATMFALNQDERYVDGIIDVVSNINSSEELIREPFGYKFVQALAEWEDDRIGAALYELSTRVNVLTYLALGLAEHGRQEALEDIERSRQRYHSDIGVHQYSVSLYLLTGEKQYLTEISESLRFPLGNGDEWAVPRAVFTVEALAHVENKESIRLLSSVVENMAELPSLDGNLYYTELLRAALISLGTVSNDLSSETIATLERGLRKLPHDRQLRLSVARAISAEGLEGIPALEEAIGNEILEFASATESLRELPPYYLPETSRGVLGMWQGGVQ